MRELYARVYQEKAHEMRMRTCNACIPGIYYLRIRLNQQSC